MFRRLVFVLLIASVLSRLPRVAAAEETSSPEFLEKLQMEGLAHSSIMTTLHVLADVYGPRLTGSPSLKAAGEWAATTMGQWGLGNGHVEPWTFGRPGWSNERLVARIVSPLIAPLSAAALAWTPGTNGVLKALAVQLLPPDNATEQQLNDYLSSMKQRVNGRIVLVGRAEAVPVNFSPPPLRRDDAALRGQYSPNAPVEPKPAAAAKSDVVGPFMASRRIDEFLLANGALLRVNDAGREHGQIVAFDSHALDPWHGLPGIVLRNEDYGRISRILADATDVELEFEIANRLYDDGRMAYNAIAELPGGDKKDEIVMVGAHLDSWHAATGATDNAIGCAVVMEAMRMLKAVGVRPRRTIRVALWSGEEQGLLGSRAYVESHFGTLEQPKPSRSSLAAYLNLDGGTGRVRGAVVFGPRQAAAIIRQLFVPLAGLGVVGAMGSESGQLGSTDSTSFSAAGLPSLNFQLDPIEYESHTHHTNLDTYERVVQGDVEASAVVVAATAYALAMREEPLPRFEASSPLKGER